MIRRTVQASLVAHVAAILVVDVAGAQVGDVPAGIEYDTLVHEGTTVHVATLLRSSNSHSVRPIAHVTLNNQFRTTTVRSLASDYQAVVAMNGYFWGPKGVDGTEEGQLVHADSTFVFDGIVVRDCYVDPVGCQKDKVILGFRKGTDLRFFTASEFASPLADPYRKHAIGSDFPLLKDEVCVAQMPDDKGSRSAIGVGDDHIVLLTTDYYLFSDKGLDKDDMCDLLLSYGAIDAMMLDGGPSVGMVVGGLHVNPLEGPATWKFGSERHVANAIGFVKREPCAPGTCPSGQYCEVIGGICFPCGSCNEDPICESECECTPTATQVSPVTAVISEETLFLVGGTCLPSNTAFWIDGCAGVTVKTQNPTLMGFSCRPTGIPGVKAGIVKDAPGGTELLTFNVTYTETCPYGYSSGDYCGDPDLGLESDWLYHCDSASGEAQWSVISDCGGAGCQMNPPGQPDVCMIATCGGLGDVCCQQSPQCGGNLSCQNGTCQQVTCTPDCSMLCGGADDGCGGSCVGCPSGTVCSGTTCQSCSGLGQPCCTQSPLCAPPYTCQGGTCTSGPQCMEQDFWSPTSMSDVDVDGSEWDRASQSVQAIPVELEVQIREDLNGNHDLQARVCKFESNMPSAIANTLYLELYGISPAQLLYAGPVVPDAMTSNTCTVWQEFTPQQSFQEGEELAVTYRIVSPEGSEGDWTYDCVESTSPPTGACWWDPEIDGTAQMTRTCL